MNEDLPIHGMRFTRVDITDLAAVEAAIEPDRMFIDTEVVSNPTLIVADVFSLADLAHRHGLFLIIDNTFLPPAMFRPVQCGAEIVINSATKFLAGHGEVFGDVISGRKEHMDPIRKKSLRLGGTLSPFAPWIILTGIRTLPLRVEWHSRNGMAVARHLASHPRFAELRYPGLELIRDIWLLLGSPGKRMGTAGFFPCGCLAANLQWPAWWRIANSSSLRQVSVKHRLSPGRSSRPMSCAARSASKMKRTSSPIWTQHLASSSRPASDRKRHRPDPVGNHQAVESFAAISQSTEELSQESRGVASLVTPLYARTSGAVLSIMWARRGRRSGRCSSRRISGST